MGTLLKNGIPEMGTKVTDAWLQRDVRIAALAAGKEACDPCFSEILSVLARIQELAEDRRDCPAGVDGFFPDDVVEIVRGQLSPRAASGRRLDPHVGLALALLA